MIDHTAAPDWPVHIERIYSATFPFAGALGLARVARDRVEGGKETYLIIQDQKELKEAL